MKKILLGTTAIVALAAISTEAFAADKIALGLGGFAKQYVGYSNHDNTPKSMRIGQRQNNEIYVNGSTTLDNGMTVAVRTEFEAASEDTGNNTDRVYMTIGSDAMGTVRLGGAAHMIDDYAGRAPMVGPNDWGDIGNWVSMNGTAEVGQAAGDIADFGDNTIKMGYHTPTFSGVTAYASYSVEDGTAASQGSALNRGTTNDSASMGVAYEGEMGGASVSADLGYYTLNGSFDTTSVGVNVGMAGFTVGGRYANIDGEAAATAAVNDVSGDQWEIGVGYETGPYSMAAAYMNSDAKATTAAGKDEWTAWQVGAGYDLGAGVGLVAQYVHSEFDNEGAVALGKSSASSIIGGIEVGF